MTMLDIRPIAPSLRPLSRGDREAIEGERKWSLVPSLKSPRTAVGVGADSAYLRLSQVQRHLTRVSVAVPCRNNGFSHGRAVAVRSMRVLVVGAGGVGAAATRIAARRDFYDRFVVADYHGSRADSAVSAAASNRFTAGAD